MGADRTQVQEHGGIDPVRREVIAAELERILESPAFRNARRSQEFLRYVVTSTLDGQGDQLKERVIGAQVFGRPPDYDTGDDSIVRVKASELRKRLAQYYQEAGPPHRVRIELSPGSYLPEFHWPEEPAPQPVEVAVPRRSPWWLSPRVMTAGGLLLLAAGLWWWRSGGPGAETALDKFWEPVYRSNRPLLICMAHPVVYQLAPGVGSLLNSDSEARIGASDLIRDPDHFVGIGDAFTMSRLSEYHGRRAKAVQLRMGNDITFADLRNSPAVLIGAFSNQWTMEMTSRLRYVFGQWDGTPGIRDQVNPAQVWRRDPARPNQDYALVSRLFDSRSGDVIITAAGIGHLGTQMAGELLTNPAYFDDAIRSAPGDWQRRNLQLVLSAEIFGKTTGPPRAVASSYW